jgi:chromosome partitioning protein
MSKVYAVANQKGGVSKTTTTRNIGAALAARGRKVLLIDLDPQGHLTLSFGVNPLTLKQHAYHMLIDDTVALSDVLLSHSASGIGLVPTNLDLSGAEIELQNDPIGGGNQALRSKIAPIRDRVDYIIIDCPPSLGLLTINALVAADGVIIPVQTQYLAYHGLQLLQRTIARVQKRVNPDLKIAGILPTLYDSRAKHHQEVLGELRANYQSVLIDIPIPVRVALADAMVAGKSIDEYEGSSDLVKLYAQIAEVIDHG